MSITMNIAVTKGEKEYELLDSGDGEKLERFGKVLLSRPDPQALWAKKLPESEWKKADGHFTRSAVEGKWVMKDAGKESKTEKKWSIGFGRLQFWIKPTAFKHVGLFPEQSANWDWVRKIISGAAGQGASAKTAGDIEVLNLFAYTGGATLACAQAGAKVVHVDGSKAAITWANENAELSGLADKPIRWILDDARVFVSREVKRERKYDGIIMDPPAFGHGADKEIWKIDEHFLALVADCTKLLKDTPLFFLINGYSAGYSAIAYKNALLPLIEKFGGEIEIGELAIEESRGVDSEKTSEKNEARLLPAGIFARWHA